jgi:hypothetical protein
VTDPIGPGAFVARTSSRRRASAALIENDGSVAAGGARLVRVICDAAR